jgi:sterol 14-demethylase
MRSPHALLERGYREKGRVFGLRLGNKKAVVLLGPENNRFFFEQTDKLLSIAEAYPFMVKMFDERLYSFGPQEEYKAQRTVVLPCFQGKKMVNYIGVMAKETRAFLDGLGEQGQFDLTSALGPLVMNVASAAFLGEDFRKALGHEFFGVFRDFSGGLEAVLPLWLPIPRLLRSQRAKRDLHRMVAERIADRRAHPRESEDFLQTLVDAKYPDGRPIPDVLIINLILMLVWAGHETTTGHASWAIVDLLRNPQYFESALAEQREVVGDSEELNLEKVNRLKRLDWHSRRASACTRWPTSSCGWPQATSRCRAFSSRRARWSSSRPR